MHVFRNNFLKNYIFLYLYILFDVLIQIKIKYILIEIICKNIFLLCKIISNEIKRANTFFAHCMSIIEIFNKFTDKSVTWNIKRLCNMNYEAFLKTGGETCIELRLPKESGSWRSKRWSLVSHESMGWWTRRDGEELSSMNPASFLFTKRSRKLREGSEIRVWWSEFDKTLRRLYYSFFRTVHGAVKEPVVPLRILTAEIPLQWRDR